MEKTSKMITAAVVLVLCAVAVIGVGYAYTAQTINSGNSAISEYIVLSQTGDGAYTFTDENTTLVVWDTVTKKVGENVITTYTMSSELPKDTSIVSGVEYHIMQVGKTFEIDATKTGGTTIATLKCAVTTTIANPATGVLLLKVINGSATTWMKMTAEGFKALSGSTWTGGNTFDITGGPSYAPSEVSVYYGYEGTTAPSTTDAPNNAISDATLTFTVDTKTA